MITFCLQNQCKFVRYPTVDTFRSDHHKRMEINIEDRIIYKNCNYSFHTKLTPAQIFDFLGFLLNSAKKKKKQQKNTKYYFI